MEYRSTRATKGMKNDPVHLHKLREGLYRDKCPICEQIEALEKELDQEITSHKQTNRAWMKKFEKTEQENKRLKTPLEFYGDKYNHMNNPYSEGMDNKVFHDHGKRAREALGKDK